MRKLKSNEMCIKLGKIHRFPIRDGVVAAKHFCIRNGGFALAAQMEIETNEMEQKEREHRERSEMKQDLLMNVIIL